MTGSWRSGEIGFSSNRRPELASGPMVRQRDAMQDKRPCTYILASQKRGTLYIGVTSDLPRRLWQHRTGETPGFASTYRVHRLVRAEFHDDMLSAIAREKQLKNWRRVWKIELIEQDNPDWRDLALTWRIADPSSHGS